MTAFATFGDSAATALHVAVTIITAITADAHAGTVPAFTNNNLRGGRNSGGKRRGGERNQ